MSRFKIILIPILLALVIGSCKTYDHLAKVSASSMRLTPAPPDSLVTQLIYPYKSALDAKMNEVLASCPENLTKARPESTLTNWVADALYNQAIKVYTEPIAFAYQNYGGIRINILGKGPVTLIKIYEIMPFDNTLVIVKLSGSEMQQFFDYMAAGGGSPVSASARYVIEAGKPVRITIHGKALDLTGSYYVAMTDYIANGGDNLVYLKDKPRLDKNVLVRDLLIKESKDKGMVKSALDQRVTLKN
ncbi:MAG: 5'-nucleotidase [Saprospiraceae bacterium]|nr:5'-nucleotidase [Saprospiraceae bacterium]